MRTAIVGLVCLACGGHTCRAQIARELRGSSYEQNRRSWDTSDGAFGHSLAKEQISQFQSAGGPLGALKSLATLLLAFNLQSGWQVGSASLLPSKGFGTQAACMERLFNSYPSIASLPAAYEAIRLGDVTMQETLNPSKPIDPEMLTVTVPPDESGLPINLADCWEASSIIEDQGCCALRGVMDVGLINKLRSVFIERFEACKSAIEKKGKRMMDGFAFKEICHRATLRYDIIMSDAEMKTVLSDKEMATLYGSKSPLLPLVNRLLGNDAKILYMGVILALPGAVVQDAHADGPHLFMSTHPDPGKHPQCPPHIVTAFIPLVDVTVEHGPTEFWPGSNMYGANDNLMPPLYGDQIPSIAFTSNIGDAVVFDYRVVHRGLANKAQEARPMFYVTYGRSWVGDDKNFPEESLGIDDEEGSQVGFGLGSKEPASKGKASKTKKRRR